MLGFPPGKLHTGATNLVSSVNYLLYVRVGDTATILKGTEKPESLLLPCSLGFVFYR
jgi:hypothetical protein